MNLLAKAWDEAAEGYEAYFVPRFAPWVGVAVEALPSLVDGPVVVPCCGTFPEAGPLVRRVGEREVVGIDLSPGMVRLAGQRVAGLGGVRVEVGDAAALQGWAGTCAGVVSVFGLHNATAPQGNRLRPFMSSTALRGERFDRLGVKFCQSPAFFGDESLEVGGIRQEESIE